MNLSQLLIDWDSPDMNKNSKMYDIDLINNPFDVMELKAANKDPFDLVPNQISVRKDPPCGNLLSPLWEPKVRQIQKSVSLTNLNKLANVFENNYVKCVDDDGIKDESKNSPITMANLYVSGNILSQTKTNCTLVNINKSKIENIQECKIEPILTQNNDELNIEKISLCDEEEKKQIREQTRQHIKELIEKEKQVYQEKCSRRSLLFCTPKRNFNENESLFNKGFLNNSSDDNSKSFDYFHKTSNNKTSNSSSIFSADELNSFDLNSLKPDWVIDSFIDNDTSMDVQIKDKSVTEGGPNNSSNQVDAKLPLNHIETIESKSNGSKIILNLMRTRRIPNKGPFLANIPLEHMVQMETEFKPVNSQAPSQSKPLASSTPVLNTIAKIKTPSSKSSTKLRRSLSSQSTSNSIKSPITQLNITKCMKKNLNNTLNDQYGSTNIPVQQNVLCSSNLINRQFKSSVNLFNEAMEKKFEIQKSFKLNKSKSESKLRRYQNQ